MSSTKLTLTMEPEVVYRAKKIAKEKNIGLSKMIENYLRYISAKGNIDQESLGYVSDRVKQLRTVNKPSDDFDHKEGYREHIFNKYS